MKGKYYNLRVFTIISVSLIFLVMLLTVIIGYDSNNEVRGTFGDMFGAANALFTGLSFVGLLVTILLQREDIISQREDAKIQNFEATFFNLLNYHKDTIYSLEKHYQRRKMRGVQIETNEYTSKGAQLMRKIFEQYLENLNGNERFNKELYRKLYKLNWDVLGHYFRGVQYLLTFVNSLHSQKYDTFYLKKKYFDIYKSQLSEYETVMVFYHFLFLEDTKYKNIAEMYGFFEFINEELVTDDKKYYDQNAFA